MRRRRDPIIWPCLIISFLLHLVAVNYIALSWREAEEARAFRARIANIPARRFEPQRMRVPEPKRLPESRMEYLPREAEPETMAEEVTRTEVAPRPPKAPEVDIALREIGTGAPPETLAFVEERKLSPHEYGWADTAGRREALDLLRIEDLARAGREPAAIIPDLHSRRDARGYLNIARLQLRGAGSRGVPLDALARYTRDHSNILVQVDQRGHGYFDQEYLLDYPIHFLFEGEGKPVTTSEYRVRFHDKEKELLAEYMRSGGLLYIEGAEGRYRFLTGMVDSLKSILKNDGGIGPIGVDHDLYHSFFDFNSGFPGEGGKDSKYPELPGESWYYPGSERGDELPADLLGSGTDSGLTKLGLWGVELEGRLVAIVSDIGLGARWARMYDLEAPAPSEPFLQAGVNLLEAPAPSEPFLQAGVNLLMYVLSREDGLTPVRERPAWEITRPRIGPRDEAPIEVASRMAAEESAILDQVADLDGSLALLHSPLGAEVAAGGLVIRLGAGYTISLLKGGINGILLHNVPAGSLWVGIEYGGKKREIEVEVLGGRVTTVTFGISRTAFLRNLRLNEQSDRVSPMDWLLGFSDLEVEEMFLAEDRDTLGD